MNRRIPSWIAVAASGVLVAASAFAQNQGSTGGDSTKPAGDASATQAPSSTSGKSSTKSSTKKSHLAKHKSSKSTASTSVAGTSAASGASAEMSRCTSMKDRGERAECARQVWETSHGTTG